MKKQFDVIPIKDYYVVVDKEAEILYNDLCLYYTHIVRVWNIEKDTHFSHLIEHIFGSGSVAGTTRKALSKIIATIGKRIGNLPLIEIPDEMDFKAEAAKLLIEGQEELLDLFTHIYSVGYKAAQSKGYSEEIDWRKIESDFRAYRQSLDGIETISAYTYFLQNKIKLSDYTLQKKRVIKSVELSVEMIGHPHKYVEQVIITNPENNIIVPVKVNYE